VRDEGGTVATTVVYRGLKAVELVLDRRREVRRSLANAGAAHGKDLLHCLGGVGLTAEDEANFAVRVAERVQADQVVVRRAVAAV
jgi:molybdopterin biosynthesis enzyme MoaB